METTTATRRKDALMHGLVTYSTGVACRSGHVSPRYAKNGGCIRCLEAERAKTKVKKSSYDRAYHRANSGKKVAATKAWRNLPGNAERRRLREAELVAADPQKKYRLDRAWRKANVERVRMSKRNRKAMLRQAEGELSLDLAARLMQEQQGRCACPCRKPLARGYHMDHIVPLVKGGPNIDSNIQLLTPRCNMQKKDKDNEVFMARQRKLYPQEAAV